MWIEKIKMFLGKINTKNGRILVLIGTIICVGIFFRAYNFSNWLHFEIDQVYDVDIVSPVVENGIANLPLLGPNVGGGMLRLGPAFYYMEYVSAKIFGDTPTGHAMDVLILSILSLPLFYIFCRRYFSTYESIGLLAIFSTSLYSVMYSRFSWSPNVLPFLMLFSFYALLRSVSPKEKHPARWFLASVFAVTITSQIHFNSLFVAPLIAVVFTAIKRPRFDWKTWLSALAIIFIIYSPVILNDLKTHGENFKRLEIKLKKTDAKGGKNTFDIQTIVRAAEYNAYEYFFINTANDQGNGLNLKDYGFSCKACTENVGLKTLAIIIFLSALAALAVALLREKDVERKNFLLLSALWFLVSFALFYTVAKSYRMYPRFFLLVSPLAIIFSGFILQYIGSGKSKLRLSIFAVIISLLMALNVQKISTVFRQLQNDPKTAADFIEVEDIFPDTNRITLEEQRRAADYMKSKYQENNYPVYIRSVSEYIPSFWYLLGKDGIYYSKDFNKNTFFLQGNYFLITYSAKGAGGVRNFTEKESRIFGKLRVQYLEPVQATILSQPESEKNMRPDLEIMSRLLTWKKLFAKQL